MQHRPTLAINEGSASGIEAAVQLYVRLENIAALSELRELRVNRLKFLSQYADTEQFSFSLLRDHCQKEITAIDAGISELLKGEPSRGNVDVYSFRMIAGWAQYVQHPEIPVTLEVYFDDKLAVQVVADRYRRDLTNLGSGYHSFEFAPPKELFLSSNVIAVRTPNGKTIGEYKKDNNARVH